MSKEDLMSLGIGEALLDLVASSAAQLGRIDDMDVDLASAASDESEAGLRVQTVDTSLVFEYLLREELIFEYDLAERRNLIDMPLRNGLVFVADEHLHVSCHVGAVIDQEDGRSVSIVPDPPLVDRLVGGDRQRPLADRVRVCSYLVRLSCKVVGLLGDPLRVDGDPVGFLRRSVGILRQLVAAMRLEQGDATGDAADRGQDETDDVEPIHVNDSTRDGGA